MAVQTYKGKTRKEWAAELGITYVALRDRITRHGWEKAVAARRYQHLTEYRYGTYEGRNAIEWAAQLGITRAAMHYRIKKFGWRRAVQMPVMGRKKKKQ